MKEYQLARYAIYAGALVVGFGIAGPGWAQNEMTQNVPVVAPAPPGPYASEQPAIPPQAAELDVSAPQGRYPQQFTPAVRPPERVAPDAGAVPMPARAYGGGARNRPEFGSSSSRREMSREEFMRRQQERRRAMQSYRTQPPEPPVAMEPPMPMEPPVPPEPPVAMEPPMPMERSLPEPVPSAGAGMIRPPAYSPYYGYGGRQRSFPAHRYGGGYGPPPSAYPNPWVPVPPPANSGGAGYGPPGE